MECGWLVGGMGLDKDRGNRDANRDMPFVPFWQNTARAESGKLILVVAEAREAREARMTGCTYVCSSNLGSKDGFSASASVLRETRGLREMLQEAE